MTTFRRLITIFSKYGARVVKWLWDHKVRILKLIAAGWPLAKLVAWVKDQLNL